MTEALITPQIIEWARLRYHLAVDIAAEKLKIKPERLEAWEKGDERPSFIQAQKLAQKLHIPFGYLFLSTPPEEKLPLPDFRTVAGSKPLPPSPEFTDLLNDILRKQQWYREYLESEGTLPIPYIGSFTRNNKPEAVAHNLREVIGINDKIRHDSFNWDQFLRTIIQKTEEVGILVFRSGIVGNNNNRKLSVEEFRGFAISDTLAPAVFINSQDAKTAQIFTLAHELAHLWIGESGISNPDYRKRSLEQIHIIDRFCDQVAAETLLPKQDFLSRWPINKELTDNLSTLAIHYRVSEFVVLRRAYECQKITADDFYTQYEELLATRNKVKGKQGGGDFHRNLFARNSLTLTTALLVAATEGHVSQKEVSTLLNIKIKTISSIQKILLDRGNANA